MEAVHSYRNLLRTFKRVFGEDIQTRTKAIIQARQKYLSNQQETNPEEIQKKIKEAYDTAQFLEKNVMQVQATKDNEGNTRFKGKITEKHEMFDQFTPIMPSHKCCSEK